MLSSEIGARFLRPDARRLITDIPSVNSDQI